MIAPIGSSTSAAPALRSLSEAGTQFSIASRRLSSGRQINQAADNPAALAVLEHMGSQARGIHQAEQNVQFGVSVVQVADSAAMQSQDALQRIRELGVQAANGALAPEDRAAIANEQQALSEQISSNVSGASVNGTNLLTATSSTAIQAGPSGGDTLDVAAQGPAVSNTLNQLNGALANFAAAPTSANAEAVISAVDSASQAFSTTQGELGAAQNRLESTLSNLRTAETAVESSRSTIGDADVAAEATQVTASRIKAELAMAVLAHGRVSSDLASRLLR